MKNSEPKFRIIFESLPRAYLVLTPDFMIAAASDTYIETSMTKRKDILGKYVFDVFPDNPDDPHADGVQKLTASLNQVLETKKPHVMSLQKYDVKNPLKNGQFEARFWRPENWPVLDNEGNVLYIIHCVEEVTHLVDVLNDASKMQQKMEEHEDKSS